MPGVRLEIRADVEVDASDVQFPQEFPASVDKRYSYVLIKAVPIEDGADQVATRDR